MKEEKMFISYRAEDLIHDDYFIRSTLYPVEESERFWQMLMEEGKLKPEEFRQAREVVRLFHRRKSRLQQKEKNSLWTAIEIENKRRLKRRIRMYYLYGIAAVWGLVFASGITAWYFSRGKDVLPEDQKAIVASVFNQEEPEGEIRLIFAGEDEVEVGGKKAEITHEEAGGIRINSKIYPNKPVKKVKVSEPGYNQLIVPVGKHSVLELSDGTRMWVNAGTRVGYPDRFTGNKREIYVNGEVFLEVHPDVDRPFIVKTGQMDIRVHGTSFNVNAYEQDREHQVVLVTGLITVKTEDAKEVPMTPDQLLVLSENNLTLKKVDVKEYIAWKEGYLMYEDENAGNLFSQLARYYGKKIEFNPDVSSLKCAGKLELIDDFDYLMGELCEVLSLSYAKRGESYVIEK